MQAVAEKPGKLVLHPGWIAFAAIALAVPMGALLLRQSVAPELPTVAELGFKGFDVSSWQGLVVPAATPKDIVERLHRDTVKLLGSAEIKGQFAKHGAEPAPTSPEKFAAYIREEIARWQKVARDAGVKPE